MKNLQSNDLLKQPFSPHSPTSKLIIRALIRFVFPESSRLPSNIAGTQNISWIQRRERLHSDILSIVYESFHKPIFSRITCQVRKTAWNTCKIIENLVMTSVRKTLSPRSLPRAAWGPPPHSPSPTRHAGQLTLLRAPLPPTTLPHLDFALAVPSAWKVFSSATQMFPSSSSFRYWLNCYLLSEDFLTTLFKNLTSFMALLFSSALTILTIILHTKHCI